jgi:pyruvate dehydrogenase E2 component (dihydrolipoamide acetyltransferase)
MDLRLPNLGEGADSGTVVNIFIKEGDKLAKDQPILELENEKAVATIPSTADGTISKVYVKVGDKISVGQRLLSLSEGGAGAAPAAAPRVTKSVEPIPLAQEAAEPEARPEPEEPETTREMGLQTPQPPPRTPGTPPPASPALRKLARDLGIDLTRVPGSARGGRILLEDVRAYIQRLQRLATQPKAASAAPGSAPAKPSPPESIDFSKWGPVEKKPLSPLRQTIARRMAENWNSIPHVTQFDNADITDLNALRKKYAPAYEQKGARLTLTSFALKVVADTLKKHAVFNTSLDEAAQQLVFKQYYHIGVAVDTDAGLIVPVIRDVDKKSLLDLSKELEELAEKARSRKVSGEELKGGTFTISNQGGIGGAHFTPIVNRPEVAILGLGRGALQPVVLDNAVAPRLLMPIGLSYDHRVIDGGSAARFIVDLVQAFQSFPESSVKI